MKVIITSGGTRERIDNVRTVSNTSSGRLGQCIAEAFLARGTEVVYIHGEHALLPAGDYEAIAVSSVDDLESKLKHALQDPEVGAVVHAMAVSDYAVSSVTSFDVLASHLAGKTKEEILETLHGFEAYGFDRRGKVGSNEAGLTVLLKPSPKIIPMIKALRNDVVLVGFKLLVGVSVEKLIEVGTALLARNHCDFVLANDLETIRDDAHVGHLIHATGAVEVFETKQAIANGIVQAVLRKD